MKLAVLDRLQSYSFYHGFQKYFRQFKQKRILQEIFRHKLHNDLQVLKFGI